MKFLNHHANMGKFVKQKEPPENRRPLIDIHITVAARTCLTARTTEVLGSIPIVYILIDALGACVAIQQAYKFPASFRISGFHVGFCQ